MGRQLEEVARGKSQRLSPKRARLPAVRWGAGAGARRSPSRDRESPPRNGGAAARAPRGFAVATAVMSLARPNPRLVVLCFSSACS